MLNQTKKLDGKVSQTSTFSNTTQMRDYKLVESYILYPCLHNNFNGYADL
jgi:hypothetical protein